MNSITAEPEVISLEETRAAMEAAAKARTAKRRAIRNRRLRIVAMGVLIPTLWVTFYDAVISRAEYKAQTKFTIQGLQQATPDSLSGFGFLGINQQTNDGKIVVDFLESPEMVARLRANYGFDQAFAGVSLDPDGSIARGAPIEKATSFWKDKSNITYESSSNVITVDVKAFRPEDALRLANGVLKEAGNVVNSLNSNMQNEAARVAQRELDIKKSDYDEARRKLAQVKGGNPLTVEVQQQQAVGKVATIEGQIANLKVERAAATATFRPTSPQMRAIEEKLAALEEQRADAIANASVGQAQTTITRDVAGQAALLDYEYAQKAYFASLQVVQQTSFTSQNQRRYIVAFVPPRLPERSNYWDKFANILAVALGSMLLMGVGALSISVVRDHMQ